jgi:UDP-N-acetylmuramoyl-tripeptide--D-alanyl-D-alanine ligase
VLGGIDGERWLVLGEMAELGDHSAAGHHEVGRSARAAGVTRLLAVGAAAREAVEAFGEGGCWYPDVGELASALKDALHPGLVVLVKGSRVNRLERLVDALLEAPPAASNGN